MFKDLMVNAKEVNNNRPFRFFRCTAKGIRYKLNHQLVSFNYQRCSFALYLKGIIFLSTTNLVRLASLDAVVWRARWAEEVADVVLRAGDERTCMALTTGTALGAGLAMAIEVVELPEPALDLSVPLPCAKQREQNTSKYIVYFKEKTIIPVEFPSVLTAAHED